MVHLRKEILFFESQDLLVGRLQQKLHLYDQNLKRLENEELRKQRMTFVDISLENVLPQDECKQIRKKHKHRSQRDDRNADPDANPEGELLLRL